MISRETEIKFRLEEEGEVIRKLEELGAEKTGEGIEHNEVFDNGELRSKGVLLRLRKFKGKSILTLKTGIEKHEFKEANEIEIEVSDFRRLKKILENLGFGVFWVYEKEKTEFLMEGAKISIDRLPFGTFIEIEGDEKEIRKAIERLGLNPRDRITETYFEIYQDFCLEKGIEMENLVLWRKSV